MWLCCRCCGDGPIWRCIPVNLLTQTGGVPVISALAHTSTLVAFMLYLGCTWTLQNKQCMPGFKFFKCSGSDICHKLNAHSWELNNTYLSALPPDLIQTLTTQLRNKTFANPNDTTMQKTCTRPGKLERPDFFFACHVCRAPDRDFALTVEIPRNYNRSFHLKTRTAFHTTRAF